MTPLRASAPLLFLLACGASDPAPEGGEEIPTEVESEEGASGPLEGEEAPEAAAISALSTSELRALEQRIVQIELAISRLENQGLMIAEHVGYEPRGTKLAARDVQSALDELEPRVSALEIRTSQSMGPPGEGLFEIPMDDPNEPGGPGGHPGEGPGGPMDGPGNHGPGESRHGGQGGEGGPGGGPGGSGQQNQGPQGGSSGGHR